MRITRREVLKLAAAQGVLLSLPRAAMAVARVSPGDGFVGAARLGGGELAVASGNGLRSRIDFYSTESGARTRRPVRVPEPLMVGAIAAFGTTIHVGGHVVVEGPPRKARAGDFKLVMADSGEPREAFDDFPRGSIVTREYDLVPWVATMDSAATELGAVQRMLDKRGVVRGFTPNGPTPTVWVAVCPEATVFSATAVRAYRGPTGEEIADLSLGTGDIDVSSVLSVSDGTTAVVASDDRRLARFWEVKGETRTELRLPDEDISRSVVQLFLVDGVYHAITADLADGSIRQWRRTGARWTRVDDAERNLIAAGSIELEMPNG